MGGIVDLLGRLPLIGRTLTIRPLCNGTDMNPWLLEVVGMPSTVRCMTTYDFLYTPPEVLNMRAIHAPSDSDSDREDPPPIPPGTINHLLLLPGSLGAAGWMHMPATYLLLRNETLYHHDAWLSTMAAAVVYLLQQDVSAEWVRVELDRIRVAFAGVYTKANASHLFAYLDRLSTPAYRSLVRREARRGNPASAPHPSLIRPSSAPRRTAAEPCVSPALTRGCRGCLVTASEALPAHCKCQHLTKFVFGLWLRGGWTQAQLVEFQLALLVEFMHRAKVPLECRFKSGATPGRWVDAHLPPPDSRELLRHATRDDAWRAWAPQVAAAAALVPPTDIVTDITVTRDVFKAKHFQFTYTSISLVFRSLWVLSGQGPYRFDMDTHGLVSLMRTAAIPDNAVRAADPSFTIPVDDAELYRIAATRPIRAFRAGVLDAARADLEEAYASASAAIHGAQLPPTLFLPDYVRRFEGAYRADLRGRYALQPNGLSTVACCIPTCPHYLRPLDTRTAPPRPSSGAVHPRLRTHLESVAAVPGLHKVCSVVSLRPFRGLCLMGARQAVQMLRDMNTIHKAAPGDVSAASVVLSLMVKAGAQTLTNGDVEGHALAIGGALGVQPRGQQEPPLPVQGHAMVL